MLEKETKRSQVEGCVGRRAHMEFDFRGEGTTHTHSKRTEAFGPKASAGNGTRPQLLQLGSDLRSSWLCVRACVCLVCVLRGLLHTFPVYIFTLRRFCCRRIELQLSCGQSGTVRLE